MSNLAEVSLCRWALCTSTRLASICEPTVAAPAPAIASSFQPVRGVGRAVYVHSCSGVTWKRGHVIVQNLARRSHLAITGGGHEVFGGHLWWAL